MNDKKLANIVSYLSSNNLSIDDIWTEGEKVCIHISRGDWKHEHLRCDDLMIDLRYAYVGIEETDEDGSDTFSATHYYIKDEFEEEFI